MLPDLLQNLAHCKHTLHSREELLVPPKSSFFAEARKLLPARCRRLNMGVYSGEFAVYLVGVRQHDEHETLLNYLIEVTKDENQT